MKIAFKNYLMGLLKLKHQHLDPLSQQPSMSVALQCDECGKQVIKAQEIYNRMRKEHPEEFVYKKPEFIPSPELEKQYGMLRDRVKNDKLYRKHIERLTRGSEAEKDFEIARANSGFYKTHTE